MQAQQYQRGRPANRTIYAATRVCSSRSVDLPQGAVIAGFRQISANPMTIAPQAQTRQPNDANPDVSPAALALIRADMLRFAMLQLGNREAAADMVQEAMESALRHLHGFSGQPSLKTWVFAILKNKIIDHLRQSRRTLNFSSLTPDGDKSGNMLESLVNERGGWRDGPRPVAWPRPARFDGRRRISFDGFKVARNE
jgi:hypothetical protein